MKQYKDLVKDVLENGLPSDDRTGTGTLSCFGRQMRFDLSKEFPLVTLKRTYWKGVVVELLWLMRGETNIKFLTDRGVHIWDEWADENGDLGNVYGKQWRDWKMSDGRSIDQLKNVINDIKTKPNCRRLMVSAWNVGELTNMALPPCHTLFQFYVRDGKLSCQLYQRSADLFLGVPFNIASYSLLTHLIAHDAGLEVGEFVHTFGDVHIYNNHIPQAKEMMDREVKSLPNLDINIDTDLMTFVDEVSSLTWEEITAKIKLNNYNPHPTIKGAVSV